MPVAEETRPVRGDIEASIGHRFARRDLLVLALTHPSYGQPHNERLEFLGDALLNLGIAEELFRRYPGLREGQLSRLRANLVREETLARLARELGVGPELRLGGGEAATGGRDRDSILADAVEALIAAISLDAGTAAALAAVSRWFAGLLAAQDPDVSHKDPKTELQEYLQGRRKPLPRYEVLEFPETGGGVCRVQAHVEGLAEPSPGEGRNRRIAEQQAARHALGALRAGEGMST